MCNIKTQELQFKTNTTNNLKVGVHLSPLVSQPQLTQIFIKRGAHCHIHMI